MPPQEGKSQRVSRFFVIWLLIHHPDKRVAIVSYADGLARRWGRDLRNDIQAHPELGLTIRADTAAANEWRLDGWDGGVVTAGIGSGLTGRPVDVLIVDDPLKDQKEADSDNTRETCKEFWRTTASARLSEDAIAVVVMTRWHEDDLAGYLMREHAEDWHLVNVPAEADHRPEKGEVDVLGRVPGQFMLSARRRTDRGWRKRRRNAGSRGWNALYQGRPAPAEGGIFKRHWWRCLPLRAVERSDGTWWATGVDEVIQSWDMTFKDTDGSDYVVGQVWGRKSAKVFLLDQVRSRMEFTESCAAVKLLSAKWPQATRKIIEDKANGPAVISALRNEVGGIVPFTPVDSKQARARAIAPFVEGGDVAVPDPADHPWVAALIDECASFPNAAHDDQVDALSQALHQLLLSKGDDLMEELVREMGLNAPAAEVVPTESWTPQANELDAIWGA
jgi:predicted phage terminase large subunit-like protein